MKIGILTYHKSRNYGAYLQSYALAAAMRDRGQEAEIIDYNMKAAAKEYLKSIFWQKSIKRILYRMKQEQVFSRARKQLPLSPDKLVTDDLSEFQKFVTGKYDCIIAGSDEIWKTDSFRGFPTPYWLQGDLGCIKVSYAASSRSDLSKLSGENQTYLKNALEDFDLIGVRDSYTLEQIGKYLKHPERLFLNCDPTFLHDFRPDRERGLAIIKKRCGIDGRLPVLLIMTKQAAIAARIGKEFAGKANIIALHNYHKTVPNIGAISPLEWVDVIAAGDLLVTTYFHGMCFAIKSNVNFISVETRNEISRAGKMYDLLNRENLLGHYLSKDEENYLGKLMDMIQDNMGRKVDFRENVKHQKELSDAYFKMFDEIGRKFGA